MKFRIYKVKSEKALFALTLVILIGLLLSGCSGVVSQARGWSGAVVDQDKLYICSAEGSVWALNSSNGNQSWNVPLESSAPSANFGCTQSAPAVAVYGTPAVAHDLLYVAAYNGKIYAFNTDTGAIRWVYPRQDHLESIVGSPTVADDSLYISCSDGKLYSLDANTGDFKWEFDAGNKIWSTPVIDGSLVYIGTLEGAFYAINAADGSKLWEFQAQGGIISTPVISGNNVYIGTFDHHLYALDSKGKEIWKFSGSNWFWARPIIYQETIYAADLNGTLYAINATGAKAGQEKWHYNTEGPISASPSLVDDLLVVGSEDGQIYILRADDGTLERTISIGAPIKSPLYAEEGTVYVRAHDDTLHAIEVATGKKLWQISLKSE